MEATHLGVLMLPDLVGSVQLGTLKVPLALGVGLRVPGSKDLGYPYLGC